MWVEYNCINFNLGLSSEGILFKGCFYLRKYSHEHTILYFFRGHSLSQLLTDHNMVGVTELNRHGDLWNNEDSMKVC